MAPGFCSGWGGSLFVGCSAFSGYLAKYHEISHSVAAQPIGAVDAAGDLAGGEKAGNSGILWIQYAGGSVDFHAAHGMVYPWDNSDGIVRGGIQRSGEAGSAKVPIPAGGHGGIPAVNGVGEGLRRDLKGLGQLAWGIP